MKFLFHIILFLVLPFTCFGASYTLKGKVVNKEDNAIIDFATVVLPESQQWATTNDKGEFIIKGGTHIKTPFSICANFARTFTSEHSNTILGVYPASLHIRSILFQIGRAHV